MKFCALLLLLLSSFFTVSPSMAASSDFSMCRIYDGHQVCVVSKKRSPKRYWNFRVVTSIDGKENPEEIYNCRGKFKILDGKISSFAKNDPLELICPSFRK
ncbi:MAG: hypothetical protein AAF378_11595 [Cyanobacteria bacterium P01_A01_bin.84]